MRYQTNRAVHFYRLVIVLAGFALLVILTPITQVAPGLYLLAGVIALFAAFQTFFPLSLFTVDYFILNITVLGSALMVGPGMSGWAVTLGMITGYIIRFFGQKRKARTYPPTDWINALFSIGILLIALVLSFEISGSEGVVTSSASSSQVYYIALILTIVLFILVRISLILIDVFLSGSQNEAGFRRDMIWFLSLELLPSPFIGIVVLGYPSTVWGAMILILALPLILVVILHELQRAHHQQGRLESELVTQNQVSGSHLETLFRFAIEATQNLDVKQLFSNVCQAVNRVAGSKRSAIYVLDLEQGVITLAHAIGISEEFISQNRSYEFAQDARTQCLHTGQPDLISDISNVNIEQEYKHLLQREGIAAVGSFPLTSPDGQIGYLSVYYEESHDFNDQEVELVQLLAAQTALAVNNSRLHERTDMALSRRVHQLSVLETIGRELAGAIYSNQLFDMILDYSMEFTNSTWGVFSVFDMENQCLHPKTHRGYRLPVDHLALEESIQTVSFQHGKPIYIPDTQEKEGFIDLSQGKAQSHLSVPLLHQSNLLGVISLESENKLAFTDNDVAFVSQLANQAAIALQNARLFSDISNVRDRLTAVLDSVREGILLFDQGGKVILTNRGVDNIIGLSPEDLLDKRLDELLPAALSKLGFENLKSIPQQLQEVSGERIVINVPPFEKILERTVTVVRGESDRPLGWMLVLRDVTDEQRMVQARELITETLIHDLRSPVSAVLGALEVMESAMPVLESEDIDMISQALQVARRGAQRVLSLIENLMDIARMQSGNMEITQTAVDLRILVAGVMNEFLPQSQEYGIILQNKIPAGWPHLYADQGKISRVVINLIDNALKYSPSGSQVTISAKVQAQNKACVWVSDGGPGIPAEYRDKIFERFGQIPGLRGRRRGTGLGLTFCKLAIEAHGGQIWVETNSRGGSDFIFTLPLTELDQPL